MAREPWREPILRGESVARVVKTFIPDRVEATDDGHVRKASFTISSAAEDRDGDIVDPAGWVLDHYRKNPIVLWAHDQSRPPIARSEKIWVADGTLKSVAVWPDRGVSPFADEVYGLVAGGFLKGTSVGFHPLEATPRGRDKGISFKRQELYEYSILPIPSNRDALIEAKAAGLEIGDVVEYCREFVEGSESGLWIERATVEKALLALGGTRVAVPAPPPVAGATTGQGGHAGAGTGSLLVEKYVRRVGGKWGVFSEDGKLLGKHDTKAEADAQLRAIEANKRGEAAPDVLKKWNEASAIALADKFMEDGQEGFFTRCVDHMTGSVEDPKGFCQWLKVNFGPGADTKDEKGGTMTVSKEGPPWAQGGDKGKDGQQQPPPQNQQQPVQLPPEIQQAHDAMMQALQQVIAQQDPTQKANALKAALEQFAAVVMGGGQQQQQPPPNQQQPPPPPPQKTIDDELTALITKTAESLPINQDELSALLKEAGVTEDELKASIKSATEAALAEARTAMTGRLRD